MITDTLLVPIPKLWYVVRCQFSNVKFQNKSSHTETWRTSNSLKIYGSGKQYYRTYNNNKKYDLS